MTNKGWKIYKIDNICEVLSSKRIFAADYVKFGIPFYRSKEIIEKAFGENISNLLYIAEEKYNDIKSKYGVPKENDILISAVGERSGIPYLVRNEEFYFKDGNLIWIRNFDDRKIFSKYLCYWFKSKIGQFTLENLMIGSAQKALTIVGIKGIELNLPPLEVQNKIAKVLSALDNKIELNNAINNNLEQQAQAIFKSWFVDFEPFGGTMPSDWKKGTFSELIEEIIGGDWGKDSENGSYTEKVYCIRGADIPDVKMGNKGKMPIRYILPKNYKQKQLKPNNIVIEISGGSPTQSTGRCTLVTQSLLDRYEKGMICTNFCRAIETKDYYSSFIYCYWQYLYRNNVFFLYENGTTGIKNLDLSGFIENEIIVIPSEKYCRDFDMLYKKVSNIIFSNGYENERLTQLRDALLPKLMSGEIDVENIDISTDKLSFS